MYTYNAFVDRVVDGDTYDVQIDLGFNMFMKEVRLRLKGIDTPETWRPSTEAEREHGEKATQFVKELIEGQFVKVRTYKMGIYGRYEADVFIEDAQGDVMELDQILRDNGFVKLDSYEEK
jgi:micrococcal nuclease